ncbi:hypothetical protein OHT59_40655 [Streptomyces sp. NBC_00243]|uniref:hypothetical protein n=1 Tax=Streptomyces sp. NBC_00243 TaxID=2975688 RepID=UPI002DDBED59|nr:hypothetical protein [Streptomyces sp. NBC_00243]WRZ24385.1 hypothetical protein OHT59_40655 [Streptomyces sp. NBC_00243]
MNPALAVKSMDELTVQYGPMRTVLHHKDATEVPREQHATYTFAILGGNKLRESAILSAGYHALSIDLIEYIDPVTGTTRYAVHHWAFPVEWATDHDMRAVAELAYEDAVRGEFARPTLRLSLERSTRGLASFYDRTDVI